jgi:poly(hydroxyalkanoate) granule-associated protein
MAEPTQETTAETPKEREHSPLFASARKVLLASIGVIALAQDEIEDFVDRLVERGEIAEKEGKQLMQEIIEKRKHKAARLEERFNKRVEDLLVRMNIPTKADIEALSEKIAALSKKVDEIKRSQPKEPKA